MLLQERKILKSRRVKEFFSILDFTTVIKQLIRDECITEEKFIRKYVEIGNCDWYNKGLIKAIFQEKECLHKRGEGIICEPLLFYDCADDVCNPALLPKYRELTTDYPRNLINEEYFRYTRYLYALYRNVLRHNDMGKRIDIINQMLKGYPESSVAIRLGGVSASMLYYVLSEENKRKIWGFIDKDSKCLCSRLNLPIALPEHMGALEADGVKAILFPSFVFLNTLRKEEKALSGNIDILDIYAVFDKAGIKCSDDFYKIKGFDEDYDVGFPFNEV